MKNFNGFFMATLILRNFIILKALNIIYLTYVYVKNFNLFQKSNFSTTHITRIGCSISENFSLVYEFLNMSIASSCMLVKVYSLKSTHIVTHIEEEDKCHKMIVKWKICFTYHKSLENHFTIMYICEYRDTAACILLILLIF